jgi:hypothetical protein
VRFAAQTGQRLSIGRPSSQFQLRAAGPRVAFDLPARGPVCVRDAPIQDPPDPVRHVEFRAAVTAREPPHLDVGGGENRDPLLRIRKTRRQFGTDGPGRAIEEHDQCFLAAPRDGLHNRRLKVRVSRQAGTGHNSARCLPGSHDTGKFACALQGGGSKAAAGVWSDLLGTVRDGTATPPRCPFLHPAQPTRRPSRRSGSAVDGPRADGPRGQGLIPRRTPSRRVTARTTTQAPSHSALGQTRRG